MLPTRFATTFAVASVVAALTLAGCGSNSSASPSPTAKSLQFGQVIDDHKSRYYSVGTSAQGVTDQFGTRLTIPITVINANNTTFNPVADIKFRDGSTTHCEDEDVRRRPALVASTTDVEIPCLGVLSDTAEGAVVTYTDAYE